MVGNKVKVFTSEHGDREVEFEWERTFHLRDYLPNQHYGWREQPDGTREYVVYQEGRWIPATPPGSSRLKEVWGL